MNITSPASGSTVKGVVSVTVDAPGVQRVNFYVDGVLKGRDPGPPFKFDWYTTNYPDGPHTLKAVSGNGKQSASLAVAVANGVPVPPPAPSGRVWPASYTTGPLGANNVLPTGPGVFLGSMFGGIGYTKIQQRAQIQARQTAMGRRYDVLHDHYDGSGTFQGVWGCEDPTAYAPTCEGYAQANGSVSLIAWTPNFTIADMNAGKADQVWSKMGAYWGSLAPQRIMLRAFNEFDGYGLPYSIRASWGDAPPYPVSPLAFVTAWHRMVDKIRAAGGTNVGFGWCPTEGVIPRDALDSYYPGDALVDWVMSDWYNTGHWSTPLHDGWARFEELFRYGALGSTLRSVYERYSARKPYMVGETGTVYAATAKGQWFRDIPAALKLMPGCVGVSFYDCDVTPPPESGIDWRVDVPTSDPASLAGFVAMAKDPVFKGSA